MDGEVTGADRAELARAVAERCLYGIDRNPTAVQLARLSLWLVTLSARSAAHLPRPSPRGRQQPRRRPAGGPGPRAGAPPLALTTGSPRSSTRTPGRRGGAGSCPNASRLALDPSDYGRGRAREGASPRATDGTGWPVAPVDAGRRPLVRARASGRPRARRASTRTCSSTRRGAHGAAVARRSRGAWTTAVAAARGARRRTLGAPLPRGVPRRATGFPGRTPGSTL